MLLQALGSRYNINSEKMLQKQLENFSNKIRGIICDPSSVHKILLHGSKVVARALLSIVEVSEEAAESLET